VSRRRGERQPWSADELAAVHDAVSSLSADPKYLGIVPLHRVAARSGVRGATLRAALTELERAGLIDLMIAQQSSAVTDSSAWHERGRGCIAYAGARSKIYSR